MRDIEHASREARVTHWPRMIAAMILALIGVSIATRDGRAQTAEHDRTPASFTTAILAGADVLIRDSLHLVRGRRIGLVCNQSSVLRDGTHLLAACAQHGITISAVFTPEHGLRGTEAAGVAVRSDSLGSIPVHSLYGARKKPSPDMLAGLDALVFDLQDAGVRFYTYISTLVLCMEAAADAGLPVIVLDRPNPLGGELVEGPLLDPRLRSFVGPLPVPIRYGLTIGELARMILGERWLNSASDPDLRIVPMRGWHRRMSYDETGLDWIAPSPNLRSPAVAAVYPGTCLLEGSTVSEGRGTAEPFLVIGAPFLVGEELARQLNARGEAGVRFEAVTFTPSSTPGAKYPGRLCEGVRIIVTDQDAFRPVRIGFLLLHTLREHAGEDFATTRFLDTLSGVPGAASIIGSAPTLEAQLSIWDAGCRAFLSRRQPYLLYD